MNIGDTVWYRITNNDIIRVYAARESASQVRTWDNGIQGWVSAFDGDKLSAGELLPAQVVRMYTHTDLGTKDEFFPELASTTFGGVADIRVSLPGSDVLYIRRAEMDMTNGESQNGSYIPPVGKFSIVGPKELPNF